MTERFLVDECCPRELAESLKALGHETLHALDCCPAADDGEIVSIARREGRIIVTFDYGFGDRATRGGQALPGLVLLNLPQLKPAEQAIRLTIALREAEPAKGWLTIVERDRIRRRAL